MPESNQRPKVTVEDLLRLKRAERPAAEFWTKFESELRQKQLTALLERRPWWQELPQFLSRRTYVPVGAAAVLAFALISVRFNTPTQLVQAGSATRSVVAASPSATPPAATLAVVQVSSPLVDHREPAKPALDDRIPVATPAEYQPAADALEGIAPSEVEKPSARSIAINLAHLEQSEPELVNAVMGNRLSSPARVQAASAPVVELASLSTGSSKRDRLLAHYNDRPLNPEPTAPEIVRERLSRRLGDAELIERFSRIGLKGDQVSLGLTLRL